MEVFILRSAFIKIYVKPKNSNIIHVLTPYKIIVSKVTNAIKIGGQTFNITKSFHIYIDIFPTAKSGKYK